VVKNEKKREKKNIYSHRQHQQKKNRREKNKKKVEREMGDMYTSADSVRRCVIEETA